MVWKYFFLFCMLLFHVLKFCLLWYRSFIVWCAPTYVLLLCFCHLCFWYDVQKIIAKINVKEITFFSKSFTVSGLTFKSLFYFKLIFWVVQDRNPVSLFYMWLPVSPEPFIEKKNLFHIEDYWFCCEVLVDYIFMGSLLGSWFYSIGLISVLCQYHIVLLSIALQYNLRQESLMPPALFFLLMIALAIWGLLWFHMNFRIFFFYFCEKWHWNFGKNHIESRDHFG